MKQQVVIIGGGTSFDTYEDYISYLKHRELNIDKLKPRRDWKDSMADELGDDFEVLLPKMPNVTYARYQEWEIWLGRIIEFLRDDVILIGHSLGGIFLAKYLSVNTFPKKIMAAILIAAPFNDANSEESLAEFLPPSTLSKFANQCGEVYLVQSENDPVVPFEQVKMYKQALPEAKTIIFKDKGHFKQESFPELVKLLRELTANLSNEVNQVK